MVATSRNLGKQPPLDDPGKGSRGGGFARGGKGKTSFGCHFAGFRRGVATKSTCSGSQAAGKFSWFRVPEFALARFASSGDTLPIARKKFFAQLPPA
jgi:hypothetical protein